MHGCASWKFDPPKTSGTMTLQADVTKQTIEERRVTCASIAEMRVLTDSKNGIAQLTTMFQEMYPESVVMLSVIGIIKYHQRRKLKRERVLDHSSICMMKISSAKRNTLGKEKENSNTEPPLPADMFEFTKRLVSNMESVKIPSAASAYHRIRKVDPHTKSSFIASICLIPPCNCSHIITDRA